MSACTTKRDGSIVRWHAGQLDECSDPKCDRAHAGIAELSAVFAFATIATDDPPACP